MRAWVLLLCGCNQIFGLRETIAIDAQQFDAPADAPFQCPPIGTQPVFGALLYQAITKNCVNYTMSQTANRAAAFCLDVGAIADGVIDGVPELTTMVPGGSLDLPRITPEGDEMWVRRKGATTQFAIYSYTSDHHWTWIRDLAVPTSNNLDQITVPSRRVGGVRHFLRYAFGEMRLYEYTDDGTTTTFVRMFDATTLGVTFVSFPNLTADGLRLVFVGSPLTSTAEQTFYADRASLDAPFAPASALTTAPVTLDPFLTEDCGRLYTNGLGSIFYAQQR